MHGGQLEGVGDGWMGRRECWAPCGALGLLVWEAAAAKSQDHYHGRLILPFSDLQAF